jgi:rubrerythrin
MPLAEKAWPICAEWSYASEKTYKALFERGAEAVAEKKDMELGPVQVCNVCGYTLEGEAPDTCPVCRAAKEKFEAFS